MDLKRIDRRRFVQLSALSLAAVRLPAHAQGTEKSTRIGYAPVGLGDISTIFMQAVALSQHSRITGLVTGHPDAKGQKFAAQYNVPSTSIYTYETYDRIRDNPAIDAVYIGLPNSMHCDYTVRAAEAGKHVLCEKPMAMSSAECRRMIDACRHANVKLMIAYRIHYDPTWLHIRDLIRNGELGQIQGFQGGFYGAKKAGEWRLDRKLAGGGSLMDLGIYPLNAIRWLAAEEPSDYTAQVATQDKSGKFSSVEESVEFTMKFPSGKLASSGSSYGEDGPCFLSIDGDQGTLFIEPAFLYAGLKFSGHGKSGPLSGASPEKAPYQFVYEADDFADCIRTNRQSRTPGEEGLADLLAMEAIYRAAGAPIA
jgi:predicted dehydrogenase